MKQPLITVIIPVYNVEKYLEKCIVSVLNQTYSDLEIILVDDGSTDQSGRICDKFQEEDRRIRVIHKKNGGLSDARNAALDVIKGEYVTFIDSDDYVSEDYVEYLYELIRISNADISICQLKKIYSETEKLDKKEEKLEVLDSICAIKNYLYQRKFTASAPCKMYRGNLFSEIRYPKGYYYEDMAVICKLLDNAKKITISNQQKYYYVQRSNSIMGEKFNQKKMHRIKIAENIREFIDGKYPELIEASDARCFLAAVQTFREIPLQEKYSIYIDEIWEKLKKYRYSVIRDRNAKKILKIIALSSFLGKRFMCILGVIYTRLR